MNPRIKAGLDEGLAALKDRRPADAVGALLPALEVAEESGAPHEEMLAHGLLAPAFFELGRLEEAEQHAQDALALAQTLDDPEGQTHYSEILEGIMGKRESVRRDEEQHLEAVEDGLEIASRHLTGGDPDAAAETLKPLVGPLMAHGPLNAEASARGMLAQALGMAGKTDEARPHALRALAIARELGEEDAEAHFGNLLRILDGPLEQNPLVLVRISAEVDSECAEAARALGDEDYARAIVHLEKALELAGEGRVPGPEATASGMMAQALLRSGERSEAKVYATRALKLAQELGDTEATAGFLEIIALAEGWKAPPGEA